jgi:hypothetical protein
MQLILGQTGAVQGSVALVQPLDIEGHVAVVTADLTLSRPDVWGHVEPTREAVLVTKPLVQLPGKAPHRSALLETMRRVRAARPAGRAQDEGMVEVKALEPRLSCFRAVRELQEAGREPVRWLLATLSRVTCDSMDQEAGRAPLNELLGSCTEVRVWTQLKLEGRLPTRARELRSRPVTAPEVQVTRAQEAVHGSSVDALHVLRLVLMPALATSSSCFT